MDIAARLLASRAARQQRENLSKPDIQAATAGAAWGHGSENLIKPYIAGQAAHKATPHKTGGGMDSMDSPECAARRRAESIRQSWWVLGVVVAVNVAYWTWHFWPPQTYEKCMVKMAEKAQGNSTIFSALANSNCRSLPRRPRESERSDADVFGDLPNAPAKMSQSSAKTGVSP